MPPEMVSNAQGTGKQLVLPALARLVSELVCQQLYLDAELTDTPVQPNAVSDIKTESRVLPLPAWALKCQDYVELAQNLRGKNET